MDRVDRYLDTHPASPYKTRNEFVTHAVAEKLAALEKEDQERALVEAYRLGKGPLERMRPKA